jgi:DNA-binding NtrC family response regulator
MRVTVIVADTHQGEVYKLCAILKRRHYRTIPIGSLDALSAAVRESACQLVILDLDSLTVDNRFFRNLSKDNPELRVIAVSSRTFHPDLEEAIRTHIFACLGKPVDEDELIYWVKSICERVPGSRASPEK